MQCAYQMPVVASLYCYAYLQELLLTKIVQVQNIPWIASSLKVLWYGSIEWNIEENFIVEWNMEWKIFGMEWKKIASTEHGKIIFHSISYHALLMRTTTLFLKHASEKHLF